MVTGLDKDLERVRKNVLIGNTDEENPTAVMGNVGHTLESANKEIGSGHADLISFGRPYMSNPGKSAFVFFYHMISCV